jgi:hypothetical protein
VSIDERRGGCQQLPEGPSNHAMQAMCKQLCEYAAEGDWLQFQAKCIRRFGLGAGVLLQHLIFWSGKSTFAEYGWIYKSRDEIMERTGLGHYEQEVAQEVQAQAPLLPGQRHGGGRGAGRGCSQHREQFRGGLRRHPF